MGIPYRFDPLGTLGNAPAFQLPDGYEFVHSVYFDGACMVGSPVLANVRSRVRFEAGIELADFDELHFLMGEYETGRYGFAIQKNNIQIHYYSSDNFRLDPILVGGYTVVDVDYRVTSLEVSVMDSAGTRTGRKEGFIADGTRNFAIGNRRTQGSFFSKMTFFRMVLSQDGKDFLFLPCKRAAGGTFHIAVGERGGMGQICTVLAGTLKERKP